MKQSVLEAAKSGLNTPWVIGQCWIWAIVLLGSFILALIFNFTSFPTTQMPLFAHGLNAGAIWAGGFFTAKRSGKKGWYYGGLQGLVYAALIMLIGFLAFDARLMIHPLLFTTLAFGIGALGGIFGVNAAR